MKTEKTVNFRVVYFFPLFKGVNMLGQLPLCGVFLANTLYTERNMSPCESLDANLPEKRDINLIAGFNNIEPGN